MKVQSLQTGKVGYDLVFNLLKVVVGEVDPLEFLRVPHDVLEDLGKTRDRAELVLLQEKSSCLLANDVLLLLTHFGIFLLGFIGSGHPAFRVVVDRNVVLLQDVGDLLVGLRADHNLFGVVLGGLITGLKLLRQVCVFVLYKV